MRASRGFSLLEVLVAVTIIGLGFATVFAGMSGSLRGLGRAEDNARRVEFARNKLAELDLIKGVRAGDSATGQFEDGTRWRLESFPFITPVEDLAEQNSASVIRLDLTIEWVGRNGPQKRVIQTYKYLPGDSASMPPLQEQLREIE